jgi:protein-disulfide isomerase
MKPLFGLATLALLLILAPVAHAADAAATPLPPHVLGSPDAPVTVNEYISLTCPHCAEFYNDTLPDLKTRYVDTGKVKFVLHDFALNGVDLKAFALASCMPDDEFFPFVSVLYKNQTAWVTAQDSDKILIQYASLGGLDPGKAKSCLNDSKIQDAIAAGVKEAGDKLGIDSTPTFIVDPGADKVLGGKTTQEFSAMFDKLLAAKK